ncbi:CLUMA_CG021597, isoform A [Clunio marinus]|uniref:CLUMA_CG021597, isoform A n=1 Tax=Clunio marinus TaxID=568069 RepID=A0A1J1J7S7_9DIPT|nr:CLUMA_CG021597, isoform A [Clunio marinus]
MLMATNTTYKYIEENLVSIAPICLRHANKAVEDLKILSKRKLAPIVISIKNLCGIGNSFLISHHYHVMLSIHVNLSATYITLFDNSTESSLNDILEFFQ